MLILGLGLGLGIIALGLFFLDGIIKTIFALVQLISSIVFWTIRYFTIDKPLRKSEYLQQRQLQNRIVKAEKEQKHKEQILQQQNKILKACLNKVREMRIKYPYADESLFQYFMKRFPSAPVNELESLEEQIRNSHLSNDMSYNMNPLPEKNYTLNDLNNIEPLEEHKENPIIMRIYKIDVDYLLHIKNIDLNADYLYQSRDYLVIFRVISQILKQQQELRKSKQNIKSEQIDTIYNSINRATQSFRRNKTDFLS